MLLLPGMCLVLAGCMEDRKAPDETDHARYEKSDTAEKTEEAVVDKKVQGILLPSIPEDTSQITYISAPAAVFTMPDTTIISDIIEEKGEEGFYSESDRNFYLQEKAAAYIEDKGIKVYFPKKRYIAFDDGIRTYYLDTQLDEERPWIALFFKATQPPVIFNPEKVEKEFKKHME